jgi:hypothetical protein
MDLALGTIHLQQSPKGTKRCDPVLNLFPNLVILTLPDLPFLAVGNLVCGHMSGHQLDSIPSGESSVCMCPPVSRCLAGLIGLSHFEARS